MRSSGRRLKLNPIILKEIKIQARSMKFAWSVFAYEMVLAIVFIMSLSIITLFSDNDYKSVVGLFPTLSISQLGIIAIVVPILTAGSIAGEKERQTFDILLMTPLSPWRIVTGKVFAAVIRIMFFILGSVPIMSISFTYGGLSWGVLFLFLLLAMVYAFFLGSIGIFCSTVSRKAILCVLLAFAFYAGIMLITTVPMVLVLIGSRGDYMWETPILTMMNPIPMFIEFFVWAMTGEGMTAEFGSFSDRMDVLGPVSSFIFQPGVMMAFNIIGVIGFSLLMIRFSAMRVDPLRTGKKAEKNFQKKNIVMQPMQMMPGALMQPMQAPQGMGQPMMNQMGQPMMNQMGQPMMNQMGQPMMNQMGQPMMNQMGQPMMNQMGQPMMNQMPQNMVAQGMQPNWDGQNLQAATVNMGEPEISRFAPKPDAGVSAMNTAPMPGSVIPVDESRS